MLNPDNLRINTNITVNTVKGVPPAKVMSPWSGGTGIAKFAGAAPFMTVHLTAIPGVHPCSSGSPNQFLSSSKHSNHMDSSVKM